MPVTRNGSAPAAAAARSRTAWVVVGVLAVAAVAVLAVREPSGDPATSVCVSRRVFGIECPTCGMTRAAGALARGQIVEATRLHPLVVPFAIQVVGLWLAWGWIVWRRVRAPSGGWLVRLAVANVVVFVAVWLLRM